MWMGSLLLIGLGVYLTAVLDRPCRAEVKEMIQTQSPYVEDRAQMRKTMGDMAALSDKVQEIQLMQRDMNAKLEMLLKREGGAR